MTSKKTVTAENLAQLGAERLADILLQLAEEQPTVKRRLRLELAGEAGAEIIAAEIGKRLTALRSARSFIDWQRRPEFVRDLDLTRAMIAERFGQARPDLALDLMWRFMTLAEPVINRVDDSNGSVGDVFRTACENLGALAARPDPTRRRSPSACSPPSQRTTTASSISWCRSSSRPWARSALRLSGTGYSPPCRNAPPGTDSTATLPPSGGRCRTWPTAKGMSMRLSLWCPARTGNTRPSPPE
jgi:hypothetical protein